MFSSGPDHITTRLVGPELRLVRDRRFDLVVLNNMKSVSS